MACSRISTLLRPLFPASTAHTRYLWHGRGAYRPIENVEDPKIQDVAKFAITEHNKHRGADLQFERVLKGEKQPVGGINYKLILAASSDRKPGKYEAVVYDMPWENIRRLTSFRFIELFGGEYGVLPDYSQQPPQKGFTLLGQMAYLYDEVHQTIEQLQQLMADLRQFIKGRGDDDEDTDHGQVINDRSSSQMSSGDDGEVIKDRSSSQMSSTVDDEDPNHGEVIQDRSSSQMSCRDDEADTGEVIQDRSSSHMSCRDDEADTDFNEVINGHSSYEMSSEDDEDTDFDDD